MLNEPDRYDIYTDGSARQGGKRCGWACVVYKNGDLIQIGYENQIENETNNRMELKALLEALIWTTKHTFQCDTVVIHCDSAYTVNMFNEWIGQMRGRCWKKADGKTPENLDLLKELAWYYDIGFPNFTVVKVDGHAGIEGNELADALCSDNKSKLKRFQDEGRLRGGRSLLPILGQGS